MQVGRSSKWVGGAFLVFAFGWLLVAFAFAAPTAQQLEKIHVAAKALTKAETSYKSGKLKEAIAAFDAAQKSLADLAEEGDLTARQLDPLTKRLNNLHDNMALDGVKLPSIGGEGETSSAAGAGSSLRFPVSAKQPIGWRGDGTGCYPAANPPLEWYRRPKGAFNSLRVLASLPKGNAPKGSAAEGQPLNMGSIQDWLVAGPFDAKDYATALDNVIEPNEAIMQPALGQSLAGKPWKAATISVTNQSYSWSRLALDFPVLYGTEALEDWQNKQGGGTLPPQISYASTNLYSAEAGTVMLRLEGAHLRAWLNGNPVKIPENQYAPGPTVELVRGWNRLTVKTASTKANWVISALVSPMPGTGYETKNIVWMAPMPGPSWSSPIVVGSKVFVNADEGTLVCLNKMNGQVLWTRALTFYHAIGSQERSQFPDLAAKAEQLDQLMLSLPADLNAGLSVNGSLADNNKALQTKEIQEKRKLEQTIQDTMGKEDKTYRCWANNRGTTTPTPVSDGHYVYVAYYGGDKGIGANVVGCFDLAGKCIWSEFTGQTGISEHGQHSTPVLSGNFLVYLSGATLFGYEKATGKVAWEKKLGRDMMAGASLVAIKAGREDAVLVPEFGMYRSSDGAELWKTDVENSILTPTVENGTISGRGAMVYGLGGRPEMFYAFAVPRSFEGGWTPQYLFKRPWKEVGLDFPDLYKFSGGSVGSFNNGIIGSLLCHDGLVYVVSEGGGLTVVDANTGAAVYTKALESLNPRLTWVFHVGICTGPTLAGKYIHIRDDQSQTLVIAPGREYKELAKNVLWELQSDGRQQEAQSSPFYEGNRIYYRTQGFLYCIGEK